MAAGHVMGLGDQPAIEVEDLAKSYNRGSVVALRGVTFTVGRGEIFGLLGRNGAGKSTAVRILTTLLRPSSGQARVMGIDVCVRPAAVRATLGVALQEAALDDLMTGREHLVLAGRLLGLVKLRARTRADELLEIFGLTAAADRIAAQYSGGMRRRLDVAMALVREPKVLFLDEPTTGLDPQSRRALWAMIRDLRDRGTAVFLTTQYIAEADALAGRVAIIHDGCLAAVDAPQRLKDRLGTTTLRLLLGPGQSPDALGAAGVEMANSGDDGWMETAVPGGEAGVAGLLARLGAAGVSIERMAIIAPSLEDVFVSFTGADIDSSPGNSEAQSFSAIRRGMGLGHRGGT